MSNRLDQNEDETIKKFRRAILVVMQRDYNGMIDLDDETITKEFVVAVARESGWCEESGPIPSELASVVFKLMKILAQDGFVRRIGDPEWN